MPEQLTLEQFGQRVKQQHPEYGDMADVDVAQRVLDKYPQYQDMVAPPSLAERAIGFEKEVATRSAKGFGQGVLGMAQQFTPTNLTEAGAFLLGGPPMLGTTKFIEGQTSEFEKARQAAEQGRTSESMGHSAAAALPIIGPMASHAGEMIGAGKAPELAGEAGAMLALTGMASGMGGGAPDITAGRSQVIQVFRPPAKDFRFEESMDRAMPELVQQGREEGLTVGSVADALVLMRHSLQRLRATYESYIAPLRKSIVIDGATELTPSLLATIDAKTAAESPAAVRAITTKAQRYARSIKLPEAEKILEQTNNRLDAFHRKDEMGQASAGEQQTAAFDLALARSLREAIYNRVNQMAGGDVAEVQRRYGAVKDMQRYAAPLAIELQRYGGKSLPKEIGEIIADAGAGLMYSKAGGTIRFARGVKRFWQPGLNDIMAKAFKNFSGTEAATPIPRLPGTAYDYPVQPLLPAGAFRMPAVESSGVRGAPAMEATQTGTRLLAPPAPTINVPARNIERGMEFEGKFPLEGQSAPGQIPRTEPPPQPSGYVKATSHKPDVTTAEPPLTDPIWGAVHRWLGSATDQQLRDALTRSSGYGTLQRLIQRELEWRGAGIASGPPPAP